MEPSTTPFREVTNSTCTDCEQPLPAGRRLRCDRCIAAAEQAVREMPGQVIRPSDVAAVRERLG